MDNTDYIKAHDECASIYDDQVKQYDSHVHEVLFGMCYEYVNPGDSLLDLGIGTGLSSVLFARAGLSITGLDGSRKMLEECRKKGFVKEIKQCNIENAALPYADNVFSHVLCCGVFHFFRDLQTPVKEAYRVLKPAGILAFTVAVLTAEDVGSARGSIPQYIEVQSSSGGPIFKHSDKYVNKIAETCGVTILKEQRILSDSGDKDIGDVLFKVFVMQK